MTRLGPRTDTSSWGSLRLSPGAVILSAKERGSVLGWVGMGVERDGSWVDVQPYRLRNWLTAAAKGIARRPSPAGTSRSPA